MERQRPKSRLLGFTVAAMIVSSAPLAHAQDTASLEAEVDALQAELEALRQQVDSAAAQARESAEWRETTSAFHLAGYGAAGYTNVENDTGAFDTATFNPIFHFEYRDRVLWETELELEIPNGEEAELNLEYTAIDVFLNDYLILQAGKFLSPLGQFSQNLHPAWINKLPSAPPGFGHDGAVVDAEVGVQLRGGAPLGAGRVNYALYAGNGPELEVEDGEIHGVLTGGFTRDQDGSKVWGGRVGFLPVAHFEIGLSAATGKTSVTVDDGAAIGADPVRNYDVVGLDIAYHRINAELRGEYIRQRVGDAPASVAPTGGDWEAWYVQGSRRLGRGPWEAVLRYGNFDSPRASQRQKQWAAGINYLISSNAIAKLAYEVNDNEVGAPIVENRWLLQVSYGY